MKTIWDWLLRLVSPEERETLLGDIAELKLDDWKALWELLGFLLRQGLAPLVDWRSWAAVIGFIALVGMPLFRGFLPAVSMPFRYWSTYQRYGAIYETGLTLQQDVCIWIGQLALLILFSWTGGYVLALVSRGNSMVTAGLTLVAFNGWWIWRGLSFGRFPVFLFAGGIVLLAPAAAGAYRYWKHGMLRRSSVVVTVFATFILIALQTWMGGWFQKAMLLSGGDISWLHTTTWHERVLPWLVIGIPAVLLLVESSVKERKEMA